MPILKVRKRNGIIENFNPEKITIAISKALASTGKSDFVLASKLSSQVVASLNSRFMSGIPSVEQIQDIIEETLIQNRLYETAKAYILYRAERAKLRQSKKIIGVSDELKLSLNAIAVLERRYLLRDESGKIIETPSQMFRRVAKAVASADKLYDIKSEIKEIEEEFYRMMSSLEFLPNSPTLMNAGTHIGQLSACFVLPIDDSLKSIFKSLGDMAIIQQSGGGTGFSFSNLRPKGDAVKSTHGIASGPVTFMQIFDKATDVIKQGGKRRGANMGILNVNHPDIVEFVTAKSNPEILKNFNLSVAVTDEFMKAVKSDKEYNLVNPRTGLSVKKIRARNIWDLIITYAWKTGDPGVIFIDEINRKNPTSNIGRIESTNPCGEQPLHPYESCVLGSINLAKMLKETKNETSDEAASNFNYEIDWEKLKLTVHKAVHFLDNIIDVNRYPLKEIEEMTKRNRKIGLGVMGFADMLLLLGIKYDSNKALKLAEKLMKFINDEAHEASRNLAKRRGSFPNFKNSLWEKHGWKEMRNATCTTIAPTGTISIIAGCSSGIEPIFALSYVRNVLEGNQLLEVNPIFEKIAKDKGFYSQELIREIAKSGSIQKLKMRENAHTLAEIHKIPDNISEIFTTAMDIVPEWHVKMQAAFQKYTDNAVSKTINFSHDASIDHVRKAFELAYNLKCKGITVYRYGSKPEQVLYIGDIERRKNPESSQFVTVDSEFSGGCQTPLCPAPA